MGVSLHIEGIKPADSDFKKKYDAYKACISAEIPLPAELNSYFNYVPPDPLGVKVSLRYSNDEAIKASITEYHGDYSGGYDIDLTKLPKDIKILRVTLG